MFMAINTTVSSSSVTIHQNLTTTTAAVVAHMTNPGAGLQNVQNLAASEQLLEIVQNLGQTTITPTPNQTKNEPLSKEPPRTPKREYKRTTKCECEKTSSATAQTLEIVQNLANTTLSQNSQTLTTTTLQNQTKKEPHSPNKEFKAAIQPLHPSPSKDPELKQKPEWHPPVHRFLKLLAQRNQEEPITASDIHQVRTWAHQVIASRNPDAMMMFLKLLSQYTFLGAKQIFFEVLKELRKATPEINQYFKDIPFDEADEGPVLSSLGIRQIIRMQEGSFGYPVGLLRQAGVTEISGLINEMIHSPLQDMIQGWLVENDRFREDPHNVPVLALKVKGKTHVFIFDSLGHNLSTSPKERQLSIVLEDLIETYRDKSIQQQPVVYSYKSKRQHGHTLDCVTFSLLDLKNLIERHLRGADNLVTFFEKQEHKNQPRSITSILANGSSLPIFEIDILPPELMKVTQSQKQIQAYVKNSPALDTSSVPVFQRFTPFGEIQESPQTLPELANKVSENERVTSDEKAMNLYIEKKRLSQMVYVLAFHFKEKKLAARLAGNAPSSSTSTSISTSSSDEPAQVSARRSMKFQDRAQDQ